MLAQSAARAGLSPVVLDGYADEDTQACSDRVVAIPAGPEGFDRQVLLDTATRLAAPGTYPLIYGSGLDASPELLEALAVGRELIGNSPAVHRRLRSPRQFFSLLDEQGMAYPESRFEPPLKTEGWLVKAGCGEGGKRVRFWDKGSVVANDEYFQRRLTGPALSVLFLADGHLAQIIGFNTQWSVSDACRPYLFSGAINRTRLSSVQRQQVSEWVGKLVPILALRGLNSLDFMMEGHCCKILELNGRPSATLGLYDADFPAGLLAEHIRACRGSLTGATAAVGSIVRAMKVFFAPAERNASFGVGLPRWCVDRPVDPSSVAAGQPLCTITAEGRSVREVQRLLAQREAWLNQTFFHFNLCPEKRPCNPMSA